MRELGPLEKPRSQDIASRVVELFTKMAEYDATEDPEAGLREEEENLSRKLGVGRAEPVFLDYLHYPQGLLLS